MGFFDGMTDKISAAMNGPEVPDKPPIEAPAVQPAPVPIKTSPTNTGPLPIAPPTTAPTLGSSPGTNTKGSFDFQQSVDSYGKGKEVVDEEDDGEKFRREEKESLERLQAQVASNTGMSGALNNY
jgi:hypothetical protein